MLSIALTGGIGSGKSTVAILFAKKNIVIIDADVIARTITEPHTDAYQSIVNKLGSKYLKIDPPEPLDRQHLRDVIFHHQDIKIWLEQLLHPIILKTIQEKIRAAQSPYTMAVIPLLTECHWQHHFDRVLVTDCDLEIQRQRLIKRDKISPAFADQILTQQASRHDRLSIADDVIDNHHLTHDELEAQVQALHTKYLSLVHTS